MSLIQDAARKEQERQRLAAAEEEAIRQKLEEQEKRKSERIKRAYLRHVKVTETERRTRLEEARELLSASKASQLLSEVQQDYWRVETDLLHHPGSTNVNTDSIPTRGTVGWDNCRFLEDFPAIWLIHKYSVNMRRSTEYFTGETFEDDWHDFTEHSTVCVYDWRRSWRREPVDLSYVIGIHVYEIGAGGTLEELCLQITRKPCMLPPDTFLARNLGGNSVYDTVDYVFPRRIQDPAQDAALKLGLLLKKDQQNGWLPDEFKRNVAVKLELIEDSEGRLSVTLDRPSGRHNR